MEHSRKETGTELLARLQSKPVVHDLEPVVLPGDLESREVIELVGDEGCAKSQFLLHVLATSILPSTLNGVTLGGCNTDVLFIDTTYTFSIVRLVTILENRLSPAFSTLSTSSESGTSLATSAGSSATGLIASSDGDDVEKLVRQCLDKLYITRCQSSAQLAITLRSLDSVLSARPSLQLLIIDDLCAFYSLDKFTSTVADFKLSIKILGELVRTHGLIVLAARCYLWTSYWRHSTHDADTTRDSNTTRGGNTDRGVKRDSTGNIKHCSEDNEYLNSWREMVTRRCTLSQTDRSNVFSAQTHSQDGATTSHSLFTVTDNGLRFNTLNNTT